MRLLLLLLNELSVKSKMNAFELDRFTSFTMTATFVTVGLPIVSVPVLSNIIALILVHKIASKIDYTESEMITISIVLQRDLNLLVRGLKSRTTFYQNTVGGSNGCPNHDRCKNNSFKLKYLTVS